ncbi:divergent polysaccharide deacetylase family protein [Pseudidiomarina sediminum]|nr:divergent polysaccharide deacetylase family protein [Pseudidiomarina sediminum]MBY6064053.1 divergent polysaccharide deacetylase family protein [Pseudidiomarina sediminum]
MRVRRLLLSIALLPALLLSATAQQSDAAATPKIAIVIDDLGHHHDHFAFTALAMPLTLAIMPFTPKAEALAAAASSQGHEVIIHMPMQRENNDLQEQGVLDRFDSKAQFIATLSAAISRLPQAVGLNNHQGSALTARPQQMQWLMQELTQQQLYFLDSRTTTLTVAEQQAEAAGVLTGRRHVFLDNAPEREAILAEWQRLLDLAHRQGYAIAIGHPYPATLAFLQNDLPLLAAAHNVELVKASELLH